MITPFKKPEGGELLDWQKEFNKQVNKIRYVIEQDRELQDLADHAYRLSPAAGNILRNHLSRGRPAFLRNRLNNPLCITNEYCRSATSDFDTGRAI